MLVFPVPSESRPTFANDYDYPRSGGRRHEGTDVFAAEGTPLLACVSGLLVQKQNPLGGNALTITTPDGTSYYYAHLSAYDGGDRSVIAGDRVGYVGTTGNAAGGAPHVHVGIYPKGSKVSINPFFELAAVAPHGSYPAAVEIVQEGIAAAKSGRLAAALSIVLMGAGAFVLGKASRHRR